MNGVTPGQAAPTPGQAFRARLHERWVARGLSIDTRPWEMLPEADREDMEAAAQAAIGAALDDGRVVSLDQHARLVAGSSARITELEVHANSLAEDLDDAGTAIAKYLEALTVMQRDRDAARAAHTAACSALSDIARRRAGRRVTQGAHITENERNRK